jgi:adenylosuccinate synthase
VNIVVIGAQWGDEGKGKIVDYLAVDADLIVRFAGGANAGHTIVHGDKTYKLHLVPSGIIYPNKTVLLGLGMVIEPESLFRELADLEAQGVDWKGRVFVANRAHVVLPSYRAMDVEQDKKRKRPIGTTGRGIGVTYAMKAARDGIRIADMYDEASVAILTEEDQAYVLKYRELMRDMVVDATSFIHKRAPNRMLLEGAQGALLDLDLGTYPFVSSGMSAAAGASLGAGFGPRKIDGVLGVFKAYATRVGNGPFPSEFREERDGKLGEHVRTLGHEFGTTTGRPRRCGYLDLVALRYACLTNSIDGLVMTKLDIYDGFSEISVCISYMVDGEETCSFPASISKLEKAQPVLKTFKGWQTDLTGITNYADLPQEAKEYIAFVEEYVNTPVTIVSVGQDREQTIIRKDPWTAY